MDGATIIDAGERYTAAGRLSLVHPIWLEGELCPCLAADRWTLLTLEDLKLPTWVGMGDRPRLAYLWAELDDDGAIVRLIPAENVAGFVPARIAPKTEERPT